MSYFKFQLIPDAIFLKQYVCPSIERVRKGTFRLSLYFKLTCDFARWVCFCDVRLAIVVRSGALQLPGGVWFTIYCCVNRNCF